MTGTINKACRFCHKMYNTEAKHECEEKKQFMERKRKYYNKKKRIYHNKTKETLRPIQTKRWRTLRKRIIESDKGRCQRCLLKYGINSYNNLEIHHIKPRVKYPELMFDENNLITLCHTCNAQLALNGLDFKWNPHDRVIDYNYHLL